MRRLWTFMVLLAGMAVLAASGVTATGAAAAVVPLITCESGYHVWQDGVDAGSYGITGEGVNHELEMEKPAGSCWKFTGSATKYGELVNEAGDCMTWNHADADVFLEGCSAAADQEWESFAWDAGGNGYQNEAALQAGNDGAVDLAAGEGNQENIGVILYAGGTRTPEDAWYLKSSG